MRPEKYPAPKQNKTAYSMGAFEKTEEGIKNAESVMEDAPKGALGGRRGLTGSSDPADIAAAHFNRMALQQEQGRLLKRAHEEAVQEDKERATPRILDSLIENKTGLVIKTKSGNIYEIQRIGGEVYTHLVRENQYYKAPIEAWQGMSLPEVGDLNVGSFGTSGVISVEAHPLSAQGNTEAVETDAMEENLDTIYRVEDVGTSAIESVHNPEAETSEPFRGLNGGSPRGRVALPEGAHFAQFDKVPFHATGHKDPNRKGFEKGFEYNINQKALEGVLLEVDGGQIFRGDDLQSRFFVVCKVQNIHVPFYISSAGTGGKRQDEWYPFFGTGGSGWLIKGAIDENTGDMFYHEEISRVQDVLNNNLKFPAEFFNIKGTVTGAASGSVLFDLNKYLKYKQVKDSAQITGYYPDPQKIFDNKSPEGPAWIGEIVAQIKTDDAGHESTETASPEKVVEQKSEKNHVTESNKTPRTLAEADHIAPNKKNRTDEEPAIQGTEEFSDGEGESAHVQEEVLPVTEGAEDTEREALSRQESLGEEKMREGRLKRGSSEVAETLHSFVRTNMFRDNDNLVELWDTHALGNIRAGTEVLEKAGSSVRRIDFQILTEALVKVATGLKEANPQSQIGVREDPDSLRQLAVRLQELPEYLRSISQNVPEEEQETSVAVRKLLESVEDVERFLSQRAQLVEDISS